MNLELKLGSYSPSPEGVTSPAGDVFALGTSLYRLLVGTDEYKSQFRIVEASLDVGVIKERFPDRQRHPLHVSRQVLTIVNRAMRTDVSKRRDTAATLGRELEQCSRSVCLGRRNRAPHPPGFGRAKTRSLDLGKQTNWSVRAAGSSEFVLARRGSCSERSHFA